MKRALHLIFLRDWHPALRDPLDLFRLSFVVGAVIFGLRPEPADEVGIRSELIGMALVTMCIGVTAASAYEIYEWAVDHWLGQHLFIGETDTITDLADGFLGAGIGGFLLVTWAVSRYGTRRVSRPLSLSGSGPRPAPQT